MKRHLPRLAYSVLLAGLLLSGAACSAVEKDPFWGEWPADKSPRTMGILLTQNLLKRPLSPPRVVTTQPGTRPAETQPEVAAGTQSTATQPDALALAAARPDFSDLRPQPGADGATTAPASQPGRRGRGRGGPQQFRFQIAYPEVCAGYGALRFAGEINDRNLIRALADHYERLFTPAGANLIPPPNTVDHSVFGVLPFELYRQTADEKYLPFGKRAADAQWAGPRPDGLTIQTRFWIDDMFMITGLQTQAYRATKDPVYLDRAAMEMSAYLDRLQTADGLFYHALQAHFYWGRGNGWVAVGMAELLSELPQNHPQRARIMDGYKKMMAALLKYQPADGMWHQLIDHPESFPESSSTGMFTYAMAVGVREGWLDAAEYKEPVRKAWIALAGFIDKDGNVGNVCAGTNQMNNLQFYLNRPKLTGDLHGQAAALWAAWALSH